jgi:D-alanine-D-alanine ligase
MLVAIVHNEVTAESSIADQDVMIQAESIEEALKSLGHETRVLGCGYDLMSLRRRLEELRPDLVFNIVESIEGKGRLIHVAPSVFDALGIPYTGCPAESILLTSNKILGKEWMRASGLPTPPWVGPCPDDMPALRGFGSQDTVPGARYIVKSVWEHASFNLKDVVLIPGTEKEKLISTMRERAPLLGGSCFAEAFVEGREFNLSVIDSPEGANVLPPAEILFDDYPDGKLRIVDHNAKWEEESFEYDHTPRTFEFPEKDAALLEELKDLARRCWDAFGLRGYVRVDFRVDAAGRPWILEVNSNPCITPYGGFMSAVGFSGSTYANAIERIVAAALAGRGRPRKAMGGGARNPMPEGLAFRREVRREDLDLVPGMAAETGFFNEEEIGISLELVEDNLRLGAEKSGYSFLFAESGGRTVGFTCYGHVPGTEGAYNLYWIVTDRAHQGRGIGQAMMRETEQLIREAGGARIYAETSGRTQYAVTRAFYERNGFALASRLDGYYAPNDARVIYCKNL